MKFVSLIAFSLFAACAFIQPLAADDYSLESVESLPKDLPKEISSALSGKGTQLVGPDGASATLVGQVGCLQRGFRRTCV
ncbi:MAG: hypothetical protein R3C02_16510 [Planctomycetaceae bacterium]